MNSEYLTFRVGHLYFGIPSVKVLEVTQSVEITPVPGGIKSVRGLINLRGQLVTAIDMHQSLGIENVENHAVQMSVILSIHGQLTCLLVDEVGDILLLAGSSFEPAPNSLSDDSKKLILGAHKLSDKLLLVLDEEQIIPTPSNAALLSNAH